MRSSELYPGRVALLSMHTSPLAVPGVGDAGGLNVYVAEVARRLGERGLKVDVFTRRESRRDPEVVEINEHARVVQIKAGPLEPVAKEDLPELTDEFADRIGERIADSPHPHDVVHSHYWLSGMAGVRLKHTLGTPLVHTMHTMARVKNASRGGAQPLEPSAREHGESVIVQQAHVLTANTPDEAAELRGQYHARGRQIVMVPPGVDLHVFHPCDQPKSRAMFGVLQDCDVVLFVGRIQPLKAPDVLIRAVAELASRPHPDAADPADGQRLRRERLRLIVIGSPSGPNAAWADGLLPLAEELGVADLVDLRPHSERAELFRWYCVADVVGVPSFNESFGLVALEAQACGRPVVATDVGGLRHAVRDGVTGVLVPGQDPVAWADALAGVLDDAAGRRRMGALGAARASTFSWDNTAASTLKAYRRALAAAERDATGGRTGH